MECEARYVLCSFDPTGQGWIFSITPKGGGILQITILFIIISMLQISVTVYTWNKSFPDTSREFHETNMKVFLLELSIRYAIELLVPLIVLLNNKAAHKAFGAR